MMGSDMDMNTVYMIPIVIASVSGTEEYEVSNDKMGYILLGRAYSPIAMGAGTPDNPYVIRSAEEFGKIRETLIEGSKVYYKLAVDVDMSSFGDWEGLNGDSPYTRAVDFDGDGHTLSNLTCRSTGSGNGGLFSVLNGEVRNLNIVNAKIGNADNKNSAVITIITSISEEAQSIAMYRERSLLLLTVMAVSSDTVTA